MLKKWKKSSVSFFFAIALVFSITLSCSAAISVSDFNVPSQTTITVDGDWYVINGHDRIFNGGCYKKKVKLDGLTLTFDFSDTNYQEMGWVGVSLGTDPDQYFTGGPTKKGQGLGFYLRTNPLANHNWGELYTQNESGGKSMGVALWSYGQSKKATVSIKKEGEKYWFYVHGVVEDVQGNEVEGVYKVAQGGPLGFKDEWAYSIDDRIGESLETLCGGTEAYLTLSATSGEKYLRGTYKVKIEQRDPSTIVAYDPLAKSKTTTTQATKTTSGNKTTTTGDSVGSTTKIDNTENNSSVATDADATSQKLTDSVSKISTDGLNPWIFIIAAAIIVILAGVVILFLAIRKSKSNNTIPPEDMQ